MADKWWKLHPIIAPLPRGFMDDDTSHQEAKEWMDKATDEIERLRATTDPVFTPDEVVKLADWQMPSIDATEPLKFRGHPFTCANRGDGNHRVAFGDLGALVPTVRGWICPFCDYTQDWAHSFMKAEKADG